MVIGFPRRATHARRDTITNMSSHLPFVETVQTSTLSNGVRVITESVDSVASASVGIWVATGSRDEEPEHRGIAHFLEHMLFKGTERRHSAKDIADEMDNVGGYLNAFTDKEYTCYYARVLSGDVPLALDLLSDMYRNSRFDPEETARERKVILEEIKERDDDPDDLVHDLFAETLYPDHPLGRAVIGTVETVSALEPDHLRGYMAKRYGPGAVIVTAAGNCDHAQVADLAERYLGDLRGRHEVIPAVRPVAAPGVVSNHVRPTEQVNFVIGASAFGVLDEERYALTVLNTVLGDSMGSRLFQEIREKRGLGYTIGSYANMHREGGYFAVYGGTSPATYVECMDTVRAELAKIREHGVSDAELARARAQARSGLVMKQESMSARMSRIGASEIYYGRVVPLAEALEKMDAVTPDDVLSVARAVIPEDPTQLNVTAIGPLKKKRVAAVRKSVSALTGAGITTTGGTKRSGGN